MLTLLSPAKKLLGFTQPFMGDSTRPLFIEQTDNLATLMKTKTKDEIAQLMDLSDDLARLNFARYKEFRLTSCPENNSYPALYLFQGDVYQGLQAKTWSKKSVEFAQTHLAILSGLYGLLRPLDTIQPYRLEMGVRFANSKGENLYDFWQKTLTAYINTQLATQKNPCLINLASIEYAKVIDIKSLNYPMITINFYEEKNNEIKMIGIYSKKARGLMAKFIMENQLDSLDDLLKFNESGYRLSKNSSPDNQLNFIRKI